VLFTSDREPSRGSIPSQVVCLSPLSETSGRVTDWSLSGDLVSSPSITLEDVLAGSQRKGSGRGMGEGWARMANASTGQLVHSAHLAD
jgi:hypothetical protein